MDNNTPIQQRNAQNEDTGLDIRALIAIVINNWMWFAASALLCLVVTAFVYKTTPKTFERTGTVLLRDDSKKSMGGSQSMDIVFQQMGMESNVSIDNEIYIMKSSPIVKNVVERLGLTTYCNRNSLFHKTTYFRNAPLELHVYNRSEANGDVALSLVVKSEEGNKYTYTLTGLYGLPVDEESKVAVYNQIVKINDDISFSIEKTSFYTAADEGVTFAMGSRPALDVARGMMSRLTIAKADKLSSILNITYSDASAERAAAVIDTLVAVYNEDVIADKNKVTQKTEDFIVERIAIISGELTDVDAQVAQLQKSTRLPDLQSAGSTLLSSSTRYTEEVVALETQLTLIKYVKEYVANPANDGDLIPANVGISSVGIQNMINTYNNQILAYQKLVNSAGPNNPQLKSTQQQLQATRSAIITSINNEIQSTNVKLNNARAQENRAMQQITNMPAQTKAVAEVTRQQKIKEELYLYLLNKREENALQQASAIANAKMVESASTFQPKITPSLMMYGMAGLVIGLAIPGLVLFCIAFFNTKLRTRQDVENALTIPVLGEIPSKPESRSSEEILVTASGNDAVTEAFRIVQSNIPFFLHEGQKIIQMVSTTPGEGKSYSSLNLALSLAFLGKKTCLIDLDLRKRTLSKTIDRQNRMGIIHYLLGKETNIANIITHSDSSEKLDYIVCEKTPPTATQLLLDSKFDELGNYLREHYDYIIFDSTPAQVVADAGIINRIADLTVYVMRVGVLRKQAFPFVQDLADKKKFKNMAILITDVPILKKRYGGYGYVYGYGYGYGYGESYGLESRDKQ